MPPSTPSPHQTPPKPSPLYPLSRPPPFKQSSHFSPFPAPVPAAARKHGLLLHPHHRTNPLIWCAAILCVIISLVLIFAGVLTLVVFLVVRPRSPSFDTANASLNSLYFDSPFSLNADATFLANFSNPNRKIDVVFEYIRLELYFKDRVISAQGVEPFAQRRGGARLLAVHMISSEVYMPPRLAAELAQQVRENRVVYNIRATIKIRSWLGVGHFSYWLYGRCDVELSAPPSGVLVARSCRTRK